MATPNHEMAIVIGGFIMKRKFILAIFIMLMGSYANAASVLIGNGIAWTYTMSGVGTDTGTITLHADVSGGTSFGWGSEGYLAGIGVKNLGDPETTPFEITGISLTGWAANNDELNSSGTACHGGDASADKRGCAYAGDGYRVSSAGGNLSIVLGIAASPGGVISDSFHFKVLWENEAGDHTGSLISADFTPVPLPAAAWLFASALMGLAVVARRRVSA